MARIQLATGRIQFDESEETYYFTTRTGEDFIVPFSELQTGEGKLLYESETNTHYLITASGNQFVFRDTGVLHAKGLTVDESYATVHGNKMTVPDGEQSLLPEEHNMIIEGPYQIEGTLQVDGKLTVI